MNYQALFEQIKLKKSFLCVGLDTDEKDSGAFAKGGRSDF